MMLQEKIRIIENFPKEGISFKDITPIFQDAQALKELIDIFKSQVEGMEIDVVVGPEARGFLIGAPLAYAIGAGFVPIRKPGKLPSDTLRYEYALEYGTDTLEIHKDAIKKGQKVLIVDDLLATGGTISSVAKLVEELGGEVVSMNFIVELTGLEGIKKLEKYNVTSLLKYEF
ncbi:MAG: adenine phosphoribosyltransferase [Clostridium sp.]|uniref:adenine phosphoribosyltransferase n=1 Tax=Clostridium sp. TaxID=1506 RepID=UPI002FCAC809